jgi:hypothetical protein
MIFQRILRIICIYTIQQVDRWVEAIETKKTKVKSVINKPIRENTWVGHVKKKHEKTLPQLNMHLMLP